MKNNISAVNVNPETGIRYGVTNNVPNWVFDESLYWDCPGEREAFADALQERALELLESGELTPIELDIDTADTDEAYRKIRSMSADELSDLVESIDHHFAQSFYDGIDSSDFARFGESEGVKMMISSLGGAPLLWVFESPNIVKARLCSPCVPNAGDLDNLDDENGYECYGLPESFYDGEE